MIPSTLKLLTLLASLGANDFSGLYVLKKPNITYTVQMKDDGNGQVTGQLSSSFITLQLKGKIRNGIASGNILGSAGLSFQARVSERQLFFDVMKRKGTGKGTLPQSGQSLVLEQKHPQKEENTTKERMETQNQQGS